MINKIMTRESEKLLAICFFVCFFFSWAPFLHAEERVTQRENEVLAIGTGVIIDENPALAKKHAISQALIKGVEQYLMLRLGSQCVVNNFQRIIQGIIPGSKEGVANYHILAEDRIGKEYNVLVHLRINEKIIENKLREAGVALAEDPEPKVIFLVSETRNGNTLYWWKDPELQSALSSAELILYNVFQERGFSPINRTSSVPAIQYPGRLKTVELEDIDILEWGKLFSADVIIYGRTEIVYEKDISMFLKSFDVNQGVQVFQGVRIEPIARGFEGEDNIIETLKKLAGQFASKMIPAIIRSTGPVDKKISFFDVTLRGLSTYKQFQIFRDFLRNDVKRVKSVRQTGVGKNFFSIKVEFTGNRNSFLDNLLTHENLPFPLKYVETEEGGILLTINQGLLKYK